MKSSAHHVVSDSIPLQKQAILALEEQFLAQTLLAPKASRNLEAHMMKYFFS